MNIVGRRSAFRSVAGAAAAGTPARPHADSAIGGMTPQPASDKARKRLAALFANYPIQQA
jgi:hypothetical protein